MTPLPAPPPCEWSVCVEPPTHQLTCVYPDLTRVRHYACEKHEPELREHLRRPDDQGAVPNEILTEGPFWTIADLSGT
jgi:hypothetical protein